MVDGTGGLEVRASSGLGTATEHHLRGREGREVCMCVCVCVCVCVCACACACVCV